MKSKKYGTLIDSDGAWTRTLSKKHKILPFELPEKINEAFEYLKKCDGINSLYVSSYQEKIGDGDIFEHVFVTARVYNDARRYELFKEVMEKIDGLYRADSRHACKYLLHNKKNYGKYCDYEDKMMCLIEFVF